MSGERVQTLLTNSAAELLVRPRVSPQAVGPPLRESLGGTNAAAVSATAFAPGPVRGSAALAASALDPITRLVAFPSFHERFPDVFARELAAGRAVGIAIGDVDNLKSYVERARSAHDLMFGHLAGNDVMSRLGRSAIDWFSQTEGVGCVATFGGDEVILAMIDVTPAGFGRHVRTLARRLADDLPCTVSFAHSTFIRPPRTIESFTVEHYLRALVLVDRALFTAKKRLRRAHVVDLRPRLLSESGWWTLGHGQRGE